MVREPGRSCIKRRAWKVREPSASRGVNGRRDGRFAGRSRRERRRTASPCRTWGTGRCTTGRRRRGAPSGRHWHTGSRPAARDEDPASPGRADRHALDLPRSGRVQNRPSCRHPDDSSLGRRGPNIAETSVSQRLAARSDSVRVRWTRMRSPRKLRVRSHRHFPSRGRRSGRFTGRPASIGGRPLDDRSVWNGVAEGHLPAERVWRMEVAKSPSGTSGPSWGRRSEARLETGWGRGSGERTTHRGFIAASHVVGRRSTILGDPVQPAAAAHAHGADRGRRPAADRDRAVAA